MSSNLKNTSFGKDLAFYFPSKLIPAALTFVLVILLTHSLAPEEYGYYVVILAYAAIADTLASAWMRQSILRYYPEYLAESIPEHFQRNAVYILLIASILTGAISAVTMKFVGYPTSLIALMLCVLLTLTAFNYLTTIYQSSRLSGNYAVVTLLQSAVQALFVLVFVYLGRFGYQFAVLAVSSGYFCGIVYMLLRRKQTRLALMPFWASLDIKLAQKLLKYGVPMSLWVLCFLLLFQANRVIIGALRSQEEVGIYASTYDLINGSISLVMTPFLLASHPAIMQLWARDGNADAIEQLLKRVIRYLLLISLPILVLSVIVNNHLFSAVFGPGYGVEGWVVPVLVATSLIGGFSMYAHKGLEVTNRTYLMLIVAVVTVAINIGLNVLFVGKYGYQAAALVALFSYSFYMFAVYWFSRKYIRIYLASRVIIHITIANGVAILATWIVVQFLPNILGSLSGILLTVTLFTLVYLTMLMATGELDMERRELISRLRSIRAGQGLSI